MTETSIELILVPLISATCGGIGWIVKRYFDGRNEERDEIKTRLTKQENKTVLVERKFSMLASIIMKCKHKDCQAKDELAELLSKGGLDGSVNYKKLE